MTKKLIMLIALWVISGSFVYGQMGGRVIPEEVLLAMNEKYPTAKNIIWKDDRAYYCAEFILSGIKFSASFSSNGQWKTTTNVFSLGDLPRIIKTALSKSKYASWEKENDVLQIVHYYKPITYRIAAKKNSITKKYLFFTIDGDFVEETLAN